MICPPTIWPKCCSTLVAARYAGPESDEYLRARVHAGPVDFRPVALCPEVTAAIFVVVFSLLAYAVVKFRKRSAADVREPAQVYGSNQVELAWTVIPVLIVVVLFLATARVIAEIQNAPSPASAIEVTVIGHQFWWEYRYPSSERGDRE